MQKADIPRVTRQRAARPVQGDQPDAKESNARPPASAVPLCRLRSLEPHVGEEFGSLWRVMFLMALEILLSDLNFGRGLE